jgi:hypothetical protein
MAIETKASHIIETLGGTTAVASDLKLPVTTVHGWERRNFIPDWRRAPLIELAMAKGVDLSTADFPAAADRISLTRAAA